MSAKIMMRMFIGAAVLPLLVGVVAISHASATTCPDAFTPVALNNEPRLTAETVAAMQELECGAAPSFKSTAALMEHLNAPD